MSENSPDLKDVINRLISVVDDETVSLRSNDTSRLESSFQSKSRLLLEYTRALSAMQTRGNTSHILASTHALNNAIKRNQEALKTQLEAVRELSSFLEAEVRRHENDGTYSRSYGNGGY